MTIDQLGKEGESKAREILKRQGYIIQSPDWLAFKDNKWICIEVKKKDRFMPPPFEGHGLDQRQVWLRTKLLNDTRIPTYLMIFEISTSVVLGAWLHELEAGRKHITLNNIVIYPFEKFTILNFDDL